MTKEISTVISEQTLTELKAQFPTDTGFVRAILPRIGMRSQDVTEGKGKETKVVAEAGTFFIDEQTDEEKDGKKIWAKEELGNSIEGTIIYQRKQLRYYDESTEEYTSSPIYDEDTEIVPLFCNKKEVDRGTPAELKAREKYQVVKDGKTKSKLEDNKILYMLYDKEIFQMNLRGTSMYAYLTYARKVFNPAVLTKFSSEAKSKGSINWNQMTFEKMRDLNDEEAKIVLSKSREIKDGVIQEKFYYAGVNESKEIIGKTFDLL